MNPGLIHASRSLRTWKNDLDINYQLVEECFVTAFPAMKDQYIFNTFQ